MGEMSKTAKAAQKAVEAGQKKQKVERSTEKIIYDIRINREAKVFHTNMEDIDVLLAEYDKLAAAIAELQPAFDAATKALKEANAELETLRATIPAGQQEHTEILREIESA